MVIRKSFPINKDGSYATWLTVPRTTKAGTYDLTVRCLTSEPGHTRIVRDAVVVTKPKK